MPCRIARGSPRSRPCAGREIRPDNSLGQLALAMILAVCVVLGLAGVIASGEPIPALSSSSLVPAAEALILLALVLAVAKVAQLCSRWPRRRAVQPGGGLEPLGEPES
jgi:hypothetical protein